MRVFTVQHISVLEKLIKTGKYKADKRFIFIRSFQFAYKWYVDQAKKRIKGWVVDHPIWVWDKRPDLKVWKHTVSSKPDGKSLYVLLELEIPENQVLLSNFDLWHFVLNQIGIPKGNQKKVSQRDKVKSWDRCLLTNKKDLAPIVKAIGEIGYRNQGIIQSIDESQLKSYKVFTVTNKRSK